MLSKPRRLATSIESERREVSPRELRVRGVSAVTERLTERAAALVGADRDVEVRALDAAPPPTVQTCSRE